MSPLPLGRHIVFTLVVYLFVCLWDAVCPSAFVCPALISQTACLFLWNSHEWLVWYQVEHIISPFHSPCFCRVIAISYGPLFYIWIFLPGLKENEFSNNLIQIFTLMRQSVMIKNCNSTAIVYRVIGSCCFTYEILGLALTLPCIGVFWNNFTQMLILMRWSVPSMDHNSTAIINGIFGPCCFTYKTHVWLKQWNW